MADEKYTGKALGLESEGEPESLEFLSDYEDKEEPEPEAEVEAPTEEEPAEETPEEPQEETPEEPEEPEAKEETDEEEPEEEKEEEPELILGRFKSWDDVAAAYRNAESWATRVSQENSTYRKQVDELSAKEKQMAEAMQQIAPLLPYAEQLMKERQEQVDWDDPAQRQAAIQAEIQRQAQPTPEAPQEPTEDFSQEIQGFAQEHPEAVSDPQIDAAMTRVIQGFWYEDGQMNRDNFPVTKQNLELAYTIAREPRLEATSTELDFVPSDNEDIQFLRDATDNPGLLQQVKANPHLLTSSEGQQLARRQAQLLDGVETAKTDAPNKSKAKAEAERKKAFVEEPGGGAPVDGAPGKRSKAPGDYDFDDVLKLADEQRSSLFG